ncbi:hypothetical protein ACFQH2_13205 [Natronoarchaeum sp. GCM10025703]|uniref:hypothetical protein n=1 Tax=Natronoarchaeum sp. GCM10025703 TaxID=3252685 RepID=UPI003619518A
MLQALSRLQIDQERQVGVERVVLPPRERGTDTAVRVRLGEWRLCGGLGRIDDGRPDRRL